MKCKHILPILLLFVLNSNIAISQDLHIYYDAQTENIRYERKGIVIHSPKVKRAATIFLHVENYNNYLFEVEVEANDVEVEVPQSGGASQMNNLIPMEGGASNILGLFNSGNMQLPGIGDLPFGTRGIEDSEISGFVNLSREMQEFNQIKSTYQQTLNELNQLGTEITAIRENIDNELEAGQINGIVLKEVEKLKYNPHLKPAQIKKLTHEYMKKVFNVKSIEEIDLSYVLERTDRRKVLSRNLGQLQQKKNAYQQQAAIIEGLAAQMALLKPAISEAETMQRSIRETYAQTQEVQAAVEEDAQKLQELIPRVKKDDLERLMRLRYEYEAIAGNTFSRTFRSPAKGDKMIFEVTFRLKDSTENVDLKPLIPVAPIEVPVSGGFKVNASLGLSFAQFKNTPKSYFVRDSILLGEDTDSFFPALTSFLHFYSQGRGNISVGGSVGIGIPIVNGGDLSSVSFFVGPSLIIGKGERIVLSSGLMGSKVERLGKGYQVGDFFESDDDLIPLRQRYELGYFLGLSYNLK